MKMPRRTWKEWKLLMLKEKKPPPSRAKQIISRTMPLEQLLNKSLIKMLLNNQWLNKRSVTLSSEKVNLQPISLYKRERAFWRSKRSKMTNKSHILSFNTNKTRSNNKTKRVKSKFNTKELRLRITLRRRCKKNSTRSLLRRRTIWKIS
jgi:hypothetical protein